MPWVKLDDGFSEHPKLEKAGPLAGWMHVCALCYCARNLTDGRIPKSKAHRLADVPKPAQLAAKLVEVGLWEVDGDDYVLHDYGDYNPTRTQVEAERRAAAERQRRARESRRDIARDNGRSSEPSHARSPDVSSGVSSSSPSPSPSPLAVTGQSVTSTAYGGGPPTDDDGNSQVSRLDALADLVGRRDCEQALAAGVTEQRRGRMLPRYIASRRAEPQLAVLVETNPDTPIEQLAELVPPRFPTGAAAPPALSIVPQLQPDPDCPDCHGEGRFWVDERGPGTLQDCGCKYPRTA